MPLAEEAAASGAPEAPLLADNKVGGIAASGAHGARSAPWRVGDLVSVWSNSERSWNDGWVVAAAGAAEQQRVTVHFNDSVDGRERAKHIRWSGGFTDGHVLRRREARTRPLARSRTRSPRSFKDSRGRVRFDHCVKVAASGAADSAQQALAVAESVIARFSVGRPYGRTRKYRSEQNNVGRTSVFGFPLKPYPGSLKRYPKRYPALRSRTICLCCGLAQSPRRGAELSTVLFERHRRRKAYAQY